MMCVGDHAIKSPMYENFIVKNKRIHSSSVLENGLMYLY